MQWTTAADCPHWQQTRHSNDRHSNELPFQIAQSPGPIKEAEGLKAASSALGLEDWMFGRKKSPICPSSPSPA
jgi:hypothetical protein